MNVAKVLGGIGLSAVLLVLALPLGEQAFVAWFALVPLLAATRGRGFLWGFVAALACIFLGAWIASTGVFYREKAFEGLVAWFYTGMGLFGFAVSITVGVWAEKGLRSKPVVWFAALAVLLEAALLFELPAHLALTQYRQPVPLLVASVGGIWAVSYLVWLCNLWLARQPWQRVAWVVPAVVVASLLLGKAWLPASGAKQTFAAIQTSLDDEEALIALHREASRANPVLVVWPEFSGIALAAPDTQPLIELAKNSAPFITTFRDDHKPLPHNAAALFSQAGESKRYFKRKPFGSERQMHAAGTEAVAVQIPLAPPPSQGEAVSETNWVGAPRGLDPGSVGLNICFDSCYPHVMRDTARLEGVQVLALPTIDPPAPHHFFAGMHNAYSPFRAAELGVPVIRADGYAYSSIVDSRGRFVAEAPPGEQVLLGQVVPGRRFTVYRALGDWFLFVCVGLFAWGLRRVRRGTDKPRPRGLPVERSGKEPGVTTFTDKPCGPVSATQPQ